MTNNNNFRIYIFGKCDRKDSRCQQSLSPRTYPLFTEAVSMVMNKKIATWVIGANPSVNGLIMDTHSKK